MIRCLVNCVHKREIGVNKFENEKSECERLNVSFLIFVVLQNHHRLSHLLIQKVNSSNYRTVNHSCVYTKAMAVFLSIVKGGNASTDKDKHYDVIENKEDVSLLILVLAVHIEVIVRELFISVEILPYIAVVCLGHNKRSPSLPQLILLPPPELNEDSDPDADCQRVSKGP